MPKLKTWYCVDWNNYTIRKTRELGPRWGYCKTAKEAKQKAITDIVAYLNDHMQNVKDYSERLSRLKGMKLNGH